MTARDFIHEAVKRALIKDGWQITADPLRIQVGIFAGLIDLAADRPIAAEKAGRKIAVEIKGFTGRSMMADLEQALGQYELYVYLLEKVEPDRKLYLAINALAFNNIFNTPEGQELCTRYALNLVVIDIPTEEVTAWIN